jgi:RNA-directed DNA polymerase
VWIPKPGRQERRPLGIPTIGDRAAQALLKAALEPEWEAVFEPNSYGFRPGRSAHDAIEAIFVGVCHKPKYVLDADIAQCFDRIDHAALLRKLKTSPTLRRAIKAWLEAGVLEGREWFPTAAGTPQGGVVSPLLANVALHGLEAAIRSAFPPRSPTNGQAGWTPIVVRYADDFVVLHQDLEVIERAKQVAAVWLGELGLELQPSKTRIVHTLREHAGQRPGFDFLGFHVGQYPAGQCHSGKLTRRTNAPVKRLGFKTLITPSTEARRRHGAALKAAVRRDRAAPQAGLIQYLNPVIRGWANYYATVTSHRVFIAEDRKVYLKLRSWAQRRHHNKATDWIVRKYWRLETGRWDFATRDGVRLQRHVRTPIRRHVKVRGDKSPYDGDWSYWAARLGRSPELPQRVACLLKQQRGRCAWCGLHFTTEDTWEIDHVRPTAQGGEHGRGNQQLLHGHCHDRKTAGDGSLARVPLTTGHATEEPDEGKPSRPVLKTSREGDRPA